MNLAEAEGDPVDLTEAEGLFLGQRLRSLGALEAEVDGHQNAQPRIGLQRNLLSTPPAAAPCPQGRITASGVDPDNRQGRGGTDLAWSSSSPL